MARASRITRQRSPPSRLTAATLQPPKVEAVVSTAPGIAASAVTCAFEPGRGGRRCQPSPPSVVV